MKIVLFQTLKDKSNPDHVEAYGPFPCTSHTAWLGHGYYFWDTHLKLAHWWGEVSQNGSYIICEAVGKMDETCWDLHGNGLHRLQFQEICEELVNSGIEKKDELLVPHVIEFFKSKDAFIYKAIRALGANSIGSKYFERYLFRLNFHSKSDAFFDLHPPVQLCLLEKKALSLHRYRVVYPTEYLENYA